jgi:hypothetical protein
MIKKMSCCAICCLLLVNCAGTIIKVMPEYGKMSVEKSKLGIILIKENMTISNPNDVVKGLGGGDPTKVFSDFFSSNFLKYAKADGKFAEVSLINSHSISNLTEANEALSKDEEITIRHPKSKTYNSDKVQFILVLDNINISRTTASGSPIMRGANAMKFVVGGGSDDLYLTGTFALWDNVSEKIVSFGKINEKGGFFNAMSKNTWIDMAKNISNKIFIGKPYGK